MSKSKQLSKHIPLWVMGAMFSISVLSNAAHAEPYKVIVKKNRPFQLMDVVYDSNNKPDPNHLVTSFRAEGDPGKPESWFRWPVYVDNPYAASPSTNLSCKNALPGGKSGTSPIATEFNLIGDGVTTFGVKGYCSGIHPGVADIGLPFDIKLGDITFSKNTIGNCAGSGCLGNGAPNTKCEEPNPEPGRDPHSCISMGPDMFAMFAYRNVFFELNHAAGLSTTLKGSFAMRLQNGGSNNIFMKDTVAPWTQSAACLSMRSRVDETDTRFTLEWSGCSHLNQGVQDYTYTFTPNASQVVFRKGVDVVEMRYGKPSIFAKSTNKFGQVIDSKGVPGRVGLKFSPLNALPEYLWSLPDEFENCSLTGEGCAFDRYPTDEIHFYSREADLTVDRLESNLVGYKGVENDLEVKVFARNLGNKAGNNVRARVFLRTNPNVRCSEGVEILGTSQNGTVPGSGVSGDGIAAITFRGTVPADLTTGTRYDLCAQVLAHGENDAGQAETDMVDNEGGLGSFVAAEAFDPAAVSIVATLPSDPVNSGNAAIPVEFTLKNKGTLPVTEVRYRLVLTTNEGLSVDGGIALLDEKTTTLSSLEEKMLQETVTLPGVLSGEYRIGLVLLPTPSELKQSNNQAVTGAFAVNADYSAVTLTDAMVGFPYCAKLFVGRVPADVVLASGELPPGLSLNGGTGEPNARDPELCGIPTRSGEFGFVMNVGSSSHPFTLKIVPSGLPLEISSTKLPPAFFGELYQTQIDVTGGVPPYRFTLGATDDQNRLHYGLQLSESGLISGVPTDYTGSLTFPVVVTDEAGTVLNANLEIALYPANKLICGGAKITGTVGDTVTDQLFASGDSGGVSYLTESSLRIEAYGLDRKLSSAEPPGLSLDDFTGRIEGTLSQAGQFQWLIRVQDSKGSAYCMIEVDVTRRANGQMVLDDGGLSDGKVNESYLDTISISERSVRYSLIGAQELPPGLQLSETGEISGTVQSSAVPRGKSYWDYPFVVRAIDAKTAEVADFALRIRVHGKASKDAEESGCGATGSNQLPDLILLVAILFSFAFSKKVLRKGV